MRTHAHQQQQSDDHDHDDGGGDDGGGEDDDWHKQAREGMSAPLTVQAWPVVSKGHTPTMLLGLRGHTDTAELPELHRSAQQVQDHKRWLTANG